MTGGKLQLAIYGKQDLYLTGSPQISFFKTIYRRYTNFSMESIRVDFEDYDDVDKYISVSESKELKCLIPRYGDLVHKIYFVCTLPAIYSNPYSDGSSATEFKWIKNIGFNMIESVSISIGDNIIDKQYGEWLCIWHEIHSVGSIVYNKLIGQQLELYNPALGNVGNGTAYPRLKTGYPSIESYKLYVPLNFWFNRSPGLALPLIALQYNEVYINFKIRKLLDLYTIIPESVGNVRNKPTTAAADNIGNFLIPSSTDVTQLDIQAHLEVNYIFLSHDERTRFANMEHEYLIETSNRIVANGYYDNANIELDMNHPTKNIAWVAKRDDLEELNDWNNYTNWVLENTAPYGNDYDDKYKFGNRASTGERFFPDYSTDITATGVTSFKYLHRDIIKNCKLMFNGMDRIESKEVGYFKYIQPHQHYLKSIGGGKEGIHVYSFSLLGRELQPYGSCNMSNIGQINIQFDINQPPKKSDGTYWYGYNFHIYSTHYNILHIMGGMGGLRYSN